MVCDTDTLEAARGTSCDPTKEQFALSFGHVDNSATSHTYLPYLIALASGDPLLGVTAAYLYETITVIQIAYEDTAPLDSIISAGTIKGTMYTGPVDGLVQDPFLGAVGALAALLIMRAFRRYGGVSSWRDAVDGWWSALTGAPSRLGTPVQVLIAILAIIGADRLNVPGYWKLWGSTNHLVGPFWLTWAAILFLMGRRTGATYAALAVAGPCLVSNTASGIVYFYGGSTILWSSLGVILYALIVYLWLRGRPRYLPLSPS